MTKPPSTASSKTGTGAHSRQAEAAPAQQTATTTSSPKANGEPDWILTDGTIGTAQSSRKVKTDITDADQFIPIEALRKVKWQIFRYIADLNANNDSAMPRIGMIAEDLDSNGLGMFCTYDANDEPDGIDYQTLSVAALRLAQDAETRIDDLAQRLTQLEKRNQQ